MASSNPPLDSVITPIAIGGTIKGEKQHTLIGWFKSKLGVVAYGGSDAKIKDDWKLLVAGEGVSQLLIDTAKSKGLPIVMGSWVSDMRRKKHWIPINEGDFLLDDSNLPQPPTVEAAPSTSVETPPQPSPPSNPPPLPTVGTALSTSVDTSPQTGPAGNLPPKPVETRAPESSRPARDPRPPTPPRPVENPQPDPEENDWNPLAVIRSAADPLKGFNLRQNRPSVETPPPPSSVENTPVPDQSHKDKGKARADTEPVSQQLSPPRSRSSTPATESLPPRQQDPISSRLSDVPEEGIDRGHYVPQYDGEGDIDLESIDRDHTTPPNDGDGEINMAGDVDYQAFLQAKEYITNEDVFWIVDHCYPAAQRDWLNKTTRYAWILRLEVHPGDLNKPEGERRRNYPMIIDFMIRHFFVVHDPLSNPSTTLKDQFLIGTKFYPTARGSYVEHEGPVLAKFPYLTLKHAQYKIEDINWWGFAYDGRVCYITGTLPDNPRPKVWTRTDLKAVWPKLDTYINYVRAEFGHESLEGSKKRHETHVTDFMNKMSIRRITQTQFEELRARER